MKNTTARWVCVAGLLLASGCDHAARAGDPASKPTTQSYGQFHNVERKDTIVKTEEEWKKELTPEQFRILRQKGTERAFTGKYWDNHEAGTYVCAGCGLALFDSKTKFESGTGWPSFYQAIADGRVHVGADNSLGMQRDEVTCARCGGQLGHVFDDGPAPTGLRYCMNSGAMNFEPAKAQATTKP